MLKKIFLWAWLITAPSLLLADTIQLSQVRVLPMREGFRVVYSLSHPTLYHVFTLERPARLVIDFKDTELTTKLNALPFPNPLVNKMRSGHPNDQDLRMVFDLAGAVSYRISSDKTSFIVDIVPTSVAETKPIVSPSWGNSAKIIAPVIHTPIEHIQPSNKKTLTVPQRNKPLPTPLKYRKMIVVIDPGHGGKDTGTVGPGGTKEKDVVLAIAKRLATIINQKPNMQAILTRNSDDFLTLRERLNFAHEKQADMFIAIHADSFFDDKSSGVSIFTLSKSGATSEAARWLANHENNSELGSVDLTELGDQSHVVRSVLIDLAQAATIRDSLRLANAILDCFDDVARVHDGRVEQAPFVVLKSPDIPSVLVETGFMSNPREEARLNSVRYQQKIAQALFQGVKKYVEHS